MKMRQISWEKGAKRHYACSTWHNFTIRSHATLGMVSSKDHILRSFFSKSLVPNWYCNNWDTLVVKIFWLACSRVILFKVSWRSCHLCIITFIIFFPITPVFFTLSEVNFTHCCPLGMCTSCTHAHHSGQSNQPAERTTQAEERRLLITEPLGGHCKCRFLPHWTFLFGKLFAYTQFM